MSKISGRMPRLWNARRRGAQSSFGRSKLMGRSKERAKLLRRTGLEDQEDEGGRRIMEGALAFQAREDMCEF